MKLFLLLCGLLFGVAPVYAAVSTGTTDSLLIELNRVLDHKKEYDSQRLNRIAELTAEFASAEANDNAKFDLGLRIYDEYKAFKYDSAFVYCQKVIRLANQLKQPEKVEVAKLKLAFVLLSSGLFKETFETLEGINPTLLKEADKQSFYFLKARAYSDLGDFNQDQVYRPTYYSKALAYADTALQYARPGSYEYLSVQEFRAQKTNNLKAGAAVYQQILRLPHLTLHQLAVSASTTAYLYELAGQTDKAVELLLVSAIADVKTATKETTAIFKLSDYCYRQGDLKNAYTFIREAREDAAFYKARQRQIEISHVSSIIEGQKINIIENQRKSLKTYAIIMTLLAGVVIGFAVISFKQLRKVRKADRVIFATNQELRERNEVLRQLNGDLNEANKIKEEYIGFYFHNNSQYIDKIETLKKRLDALLASKQYAGVQKLVDGVNIKTERNELLKGFDTVFLRLFPNFIAQFNALFSDEERVKLTDDQLLTTELRIFALIRLGIDDSEQISRMLGYSINTIYTYKTRVKNRSFLPNEEFEARIQAIQAV
ncbi:DUF6377 domain-containing protein [Hymenobacter negativus]|uniref:Tetratricopeptide repeat protein n=1 Tax=Hymenobacter negativus TaxID=2795026 RepID=A0ABS0QCS0_9BACT|nr:MULTISPECIES: DUF6377 domain-containing protein [Bacteria]MBH8560491.1 tetratricopeptide repeat protein [Hymenobacter negativus]MBH8570874.1 tetratricopeptide repeat protein [Hymenobacter negativus]MBR7210611.1 hypothetical protein [Microvirga sp. STS02]